MDRELSCMILFVEREILKEQWLACKGFAYPINRAAREMLYSAVLQEYDRLRSEEELRRQETKLQVS